jgi:hypothetical protein
VGLWTATAPFTVTVTRRFAFLASGSTGAAALTRSSSETPVPLRCPTVKLCSGSAASWARV